MTTHPMFDPLTEDTDPGVLDLVDDLIRAMGGDRYCIWLATQPVEWLTTTPAEEIVAAMRAKLDEETR